MVKYRMRLFIAVNFDDEIKKKILEVREQLRSQSLHGNFTRPENFHLTLAFLGETPEEKLISLARIMEKLNSPPFEICFIRSGCFTHSRKELWWIGATPDDPGLLFLKNIHAQLTEMLSEENFFVDKRPFNAHITLGREVKHAGTVSLDCPKITVKVESACLMKSEHVHGVLTYTTLLEKFFNGAET